MHVRGTDEKSHKGMKGHCWKAQKNDPSRVIKESGERLDGSSLRAFHKVRGKQKRPGRKGQYFGR